MGQPVTMPRPSYSRLAPVMLTVAAGCCLIVLGRDDFTLVVAGSALAGLGGILLLGLLFYEVGRSEDRARAAERRRSQLRSRP